MYIINTIKIQRDLIGVRNRYTTYTDAYWIHELLKKTELGAKHFIFTKMFNLLFLIYKSVVMDGYSLIKSVIIWSLNGDKTHPSILVPFLFCAWPCSGGLMYQLCTLTKRLCAPCSMHMLECI